MLKWVKQLGRKKQRNPKHLEFWFRHDGTGEPDAQHKACEDCRHIYGLVTMWCKSEEAIERRNTRIAGTHNCPQWEPMLKATEADKRDERVVVLTLKGARMSKIDKETDHGNV